MLEAVAGKVYRIGAEPGLGSTVKIIHQLLAGVHIAAGAEAMALAARAGIPLDVMYDVVTNAAGNSWMFENRMRHVVDGDYTPHSAVYIFVKDFGPVADTAKALHFPLPLASTALNMFTSASNAGYGKEDDSAVIKRFSLASLYRERNHDQDLALSPMILPARRISPVFWWKTVYQRYKLTVFQQVKCRKQSTHW